MTRRATTPESAVLRQVLALLKLRGIPHWRSNTGAARIGGRFVRFGSPGVSDVIAICPRSGRFWAIEAKRAGGRPTADQLAFLGSVLRAGGVASIISDVNDLHRFLNKLEDDPWCGWNLEGPLR